MTELIPNRFFSRRRLAMIACAASVASAFAWFAWTSYVRSRRRPPPIDEHPDGNDQVEEKTAESPRPPPTDTETLYSMQYLTAIRSNRPELLDDMRYHPMNHEVSALPGENPIAIWSTIRFHQHSTFVTSVLRTLLRCGAKRFINLAIDDRGRPIDQATEITFPILIERRLSLGIDLLPTKLHSPLLRMIRLAVGPSNCSVVIRTVADSDPDLLDWSDPANNGQTALHAACVAAVHRPYMIRVINDLLTVGFRSVSPNRTCFQQMPITGPPIVVSTLVWLRDRIDAERRLIDPKLRSTTAFVGPLRSLILEFVL